mmetsp:Transcript_28926/g.85644  ORF Transcript_28926/g.85644 Transcript_28926/m.85644 type:complete len:765 (-) Transcript_28926:338-2632(-)
MSGASSGLQSVLAALPRRNRRIIAVAVVAGSIAVGHQVRSVVLDARRQQAALSRDIHGSSRAGGGKRGTRPAVDAQFMQRLKLILSICIPSVFSKEAGLIAIQTLLLVSRTLLTDWIARIEGQAGGMLTAQNFPGFARRIAMFAGVGLPAAIVNSGLKYMQKVIELTFQRRLTEYLHNEYCKNRAYYAASNLGGMSSADQRITEDLEKFCFSVSELYSYTFKPVLDVVYFTRTLSRTMGYRPQFALYGYYMLVAALLRHISPPLAQMTATEAGLTGAFRGAHQRLVTYSEEVAYNDPPGGAAEQLILNQHLRRLVKYSGLSALQRFVQQIADGYLVKYLASVSCLLLYAAPIYFRDPSLRASQADLTRDYISSMRLLQNTNRGIGDIVLVYKRMTNLASHTSRVSELLEQVHALSGEDVEHRELFKRNVSHNHMWGLVATGGPASNGEDLEPLPPRRLLGDVISFERVCLDSPDGTPLVRELSFQVVPGCSTMLMGQNGSGKSSLFRVMAGLWPLLAGEVTVPEARRVFYLSQRPYLVTGTLRDQLLYPFPPRAVWGAAGPCERGAYVQQAGRHPPIKITPELDAELEDCLRAVELDYLLSRGDAWDQVQPWQETLSGGEKQRLAMARLLYHRPAFAVLDECTSAVSADGELKLYSALVASGVTCFSIAHRPALRRFHTQVVHFDGTLSSKTGLGWRVEQLNDMAQQPPSAGPTPTSTPMRQRPPGGRHGGGGAAAPSPCTGGTPSSYAASARHMPTSPSGMVP